jgi:hypothetical protein
MPRRIQIALITNQSTCGGNKKAGLVCTIGSRNFSHVQRKTAPNFTLGCTRGIPVSCCNITPKPI